MQCLPKINTSWHITRKSEKLKPNWTERRWHIKKKKHYFVFGTSGFLFSFMVISSLPLGIFVWLLLVHLLVHSLVQSISFGCSLPQLVSVTNKGQKMTVDVEHEKRNIHTNNIYLFDSVQMTKWTQYSMCLPHCCCLQTSFPFFSQCKLLFTKLFCTFFRCHFKDGENNNSAYCVTQRCTFRVRSVNREYDVKINGK